MAKNEVPPATGTGVMHDHQISVPQGQGNVPPMGGNSSITTHATPGNTISGGNVAPSGVAAQAPSPVSKPAATVVGGLIQGENPAGGGKDVGSDDIAGTQGTGAGAGLHDHPSDSGISFPGP